MRPRALPRLVGRIGRRSMMIRRNTYGVAALALGLAVSTLATPSFAQRAEQGEAGMSRALRECNGRKNEPVHLGRPAGPQLPLLHDAARPTGITLIALPPLTGSPRQQKRVYARL